MTPPGGVSGHPALGDVDEHVDVVLVPAHVLVLDEPLDLLLKIRIILLLGMKKACFWIRPFFGSGSSSEIFLPWPSGRGTAPVFCKQN